MSTPTIPPTSNISRQCADFPADFWGDFFIQYVSAPKEVEEKMDNQIVMLKEKVRKMLISTTEDSSTFLPKASLIDSLQRLGLSYHFEHEIDEVLQHIHRDYVENGTMTLDEDLHSVALIFRLLRQQGYHILSDVFDKFKNEEGNFDENLTSNVEGMLSLYEASNLSIHGEELLDEALVFTHKHLQLMIPQLSQSLAVKVKHSLNWPLRKNLPRLEARYFISAYEQDPSHDKTLLLFAKLDFNKLQAQHRKELENVSKWCKDLDLAAKLPFARNRMVEGYFWSMGAYFEPKYSLARDLLAKMIVFITLIDDMYDSYGTIEELQLFTEAIERWDISYKDTLPEYAQHFYQAVLDFYDGIEQEVTKEGRAFAAIYAKNELKRNVQAYFAEAKWLNSNYTPTLEEYFGVALTSTAYPMLMSVSFSGMGCLVTEQIFQWLAKRPKIIQALTVICRLEDDIVSHEFEKKRGHVASAIDCYMEQHGVTKEDAINELYKQVASAWKDINEECLNSTEVPKPVLELVLNYARVMEVLYKDEDGYTFSKGATKDKIVATLVNPISI